MCASCMVLAKASVIKSFCALSDSSLFHDCKKSGGIVSALSSPPTHSIRKAAFICLKRYGHCFRNCGNLLLYPDSSFHPDVFVARILTSVLCMITKSWRVNGQFSLPGAHIPTNLAAEGRVSGAAAPDISQRLKSYAALR